MPTVQLNPNQHSKNKCCSFCRKANHTIQDCDSIFIKIELDKIEIKIENTINILLNELTRRINIGTFQYDQFLNLIRTFITSWIKKLNKSTMIAMIYSIKKTNEFYLEGLTINTKYNKKQYIELLINYYSDIILDAINFHNYLMSIKFKKMITKRIVKFLHNLTMTNFPERDAQQYYYYIVNMYFYRKKVRDIELLEILNSIQMNPYFNSYYVSLGGQKQLRLNIIINMMAGFINNIPKITFAQEFLTTTDNMVAQEDVFDCGICFEEFKCTEDVKLNCDHSFCKDCTFKTMETNLQKNVVPPCPFCRIPIVKVSIKNEEIYSEFMARFEKHV